MGSEDNMKSLDEWHKKWGPAKSEDPQVIEYLSKKGYSKTENMLRMESANQDVDPNSMMTRPEKPETVRFTQAFGQSSKYT